MRRGFTRGKNRYANSFHDKISFRRDRGRKLKGKEKEGEKNMVATSARSAPLNWEHSNIADPGQNEQIKKEVVSINDGRDDAARFSA